MSSLLRLKPHQKDFLKYISNSHIFHFLSHSFGTETTNTLIHNCSSFVNHIRFQPIMGKIYAHFHTKTAQKPYTLGWHMPTWHKYFKGNWSWIIITILGMRSYSIGYSSSEAISACTGKGIVFMLLEFFPFFFKGLMQSYPAVSHHLLGPPCCPTLLRFLYLKCNNQM